MADWFLAPTLQQFRSEVNALYPKRDKTSDGTIGNASHSSSTSDHNPDVRGCVCAIDIDEDLLGPTDAYPSFHAGSAARPLVDQIIARAKAGLLPQLYYVIYERKIYSRTYSFEAREYTGSNPHGHHFHVSVYHSAELADSTKPWGLAEPVNKLRVLTQNGRKSNILEISNSRKWDARLPHMIKHLRSIKPAVVGGQEFTVTQCNDVMEAFPNWTYSGGVTFGNCPIFWNTDLLRAEEGTLLEKKYPSGQRERYLTLIRLQHRSLDWGGWFGSIHLAAGGSTEPNEAALRKAQMTAMVRDVQAWVAEHPHPEDGKPNIIICADLNDTQSDQAGVRKIAYELGGWKALRTRLPLDKISGDTYRSFNGWRKTSSLPRDSKAIDDILTSGITLEDAALRRTCTDVYPLHASDHNGYSADILI